MFAWLKSAYYTLRFALEALALRFELIDRVLEHDATSLRAVKAVTAAEEYLADHFPTFPVLPGVMMLEALVQAARQFVARTDGEPDRPLVASEVVNLKYGNMVRPGETLHVTVTLRDRDDSGYSFLGEGVVNGKTAVKGRFRLAPLPPDGAEAPPAPDA